MLDLSKADTLSMCFKVHLAVLRRSANSGGEEEERYVAVKTVTNSDFNSEDVLREIELISRCRHENIVEYVGQYTTGFGVHIVTGRKYRMNLSPTYHSNLSRVHGRW